MCKKKTKEKESLNYVFWIKKESQQILNLNLIKFIQNGVTIENIVWYVLAFKEQREYPPLLIPKATTPTT